MTLPPFERTIKCIFKDLGVFEVLEYSPQFSTDDPFDVIFQKMKEIGFFQLSMTYLSFQQPSGSGYSEDEFGNYVLEKISADDYVRQTYSQFLSNLSFEYEDREQDNANMKIKSMAMLFVNEGEDYYELNIPFSKKEKLASSCIWENFKNFISIDKKRKLVQLITMGKD